MTSERETELLDISKDSSDADNPNDGKKEDRISLWLAGSIIFFLIAVFAIAALMVNKIYFQPPVIRTAAEKDLIKYRTAIKNNPKDTQAYIGLADVYLTIGQPKDAINQFNKALELEPRSWNAHFGIGLAYQAVHDDDKAILHLSKAGTFDPHNELSFYQLGKLYQDQKDYGKAVQSFKNALKVNPTLADAHYYLGQCYEGTNKFNLAKQEYREALKYVDKYPEAEKALSRLK